MGTQQESTTSRIGASIKKRRALVIGWNWGLCVQISLDCFSTIQTLASALIFGVSSDAPCPIPVIATTPEDEEQTPQCQWPNSFVSFHNVTYLRLFRFRHRHLASSPQVLGRRTKLQILVLNLSYDSLVAGIDSFSSPRW